MAVVRITDELKKSVLHNVYAQFDRQQDDAHKLRPEIGQDVYNIVLKKFLDEVRNVNKIYFNTMNKLIIRIRGTVEGDVYESWDLDKPCIVPYALPKSEGAWTVSSYTNNTEINNDPQFHDVYERVNEWQSALAKVKNDRATAQHAVSKVLDGSATLAPALRAWPALWDLLPKHYQDKHKEITDRAKPAKPDIAMDLEKLEGLTAKLAIANITKKMESK